MSSFLLSPCPLRVHTLPQGQQEHSATQEEGRGCCPGCQGPWKPLSLLTPPQHGGKAIPQWTLGKYKHSPETWRSSAQACTWGPAPGGPAPGGLYLGDLHLRGLHRQLGAGARASFPVPQLMPARYLSSPSVSVPSKNRKRTG